MIDDFKGAIHVYPTSLDLPDLAWDSERIREPGTTFERRRDVPQKDCALCQSGQCVQVVQRNNEWECPVIVHSLMVLN